MQIKERLRSPGTLLGLTAIAIALGGTAVALPGRNSVNSGDIINGQVKGKDVQERTLSAVPQLRHLPGKKVTATSAATAVEAQAAAPQIVIVRRGPITIYGKCFRGDDTGNVEAKIYAASTQPNGVMASGEAIIDGDTTPPYLAPGVLEEDREVDDRVAGADSASIWTPDDDKATIMVGGTTLTYFPWLGAKQGNLAAGNGPYGPGNRCFFGGAVIG